MFFNKLRTGSAVEPINVAGILVLLIACALLWFPGSPLNTGTSRKQDMAGTPKAAPAASYRDLGNDKVQPNGTYAARDSNTTLAGGGVHADFYGQEGTGAGAGADTKGPIIVFVMGASSSANSSLGAALAASLGLPFTDADALYSQGLNKDMDMDPGADAGDQQWLEALRDSVLRALEDQADEAHNAKLDPEARKGEEHEKLGYGHGIVVGCTAPGKKYRAAFRGLGRNEPECGCSRNGQCSQNCPCCPPGMNGYYPATYFVDVAVTAGQPALLEEMGMGNRTGADDFGKAGVRDPESADVDGEENVVVVPLDVSMEEQVRVAREGLTALGAIRSEY